jgi:hypothetical protein
MRSSINGRLPPPEGAWPGKQNPEQQPRQRKSDSREGNNLRTRSLAYGHIRMKPCSITLIPLLDGNAKPQRA